MLRVKLVGKVHPPSPYTGVPPFGRDVLSQAGGWGVLSRPAKYGLLKRFKVVDPHTEPNMAPVTVILKTAWFSLTHPWRYQWWIRRAYRDGLIDPARWMR